ncbi:MlaD family protein [Nocardia huaxiensis]|uniref:MCE family protein n=1 Tax=Nocardia huaxiensis TaxID=2755382 RepID=A0A7D6VAI2_9NOCA|nr:MlaD family protein [Nocardia huaxiensis]QLY30451.1 MCE family protein [Nocardia huaxiensis]UFS95950.1 MlaD family protein [Nocardia huaxiensis]
MSKYVMPGVPTGPKRSITVGAAALALTVLVLLGWTVRAQTRTETGLPITLHTERIGDGVLTGTQVRLNGVQVGEVTAITPADNGTQLIELRLDQDQLAGLDDSLRIDYAPANLFGISEIVLRRGAGGSPLRAGSEVDLTGLRANGVYDATLSGLLRSLAGVSNDVLTPQLSTVLGQLAADFHAFTPFLQTVVMLARTVAERQQVAPSELLGQYGSALEGGAQFVDSTLRVIDQVSGIEVLRTDREQFDATVAVIVDKLFPTLSATLFHAGDNFSGYTDMLAPLLRVLAQMVPAPQQSSAELRALLDRVRTAMPDTPAGPVLNLDIDLRGVPAVAVPLLGAAGGAR